MDQKSVELIFDNFVYVDNVLYMKTPTPNQVSKLIGGIHYNKASVHQRYRKGSYSILLDNQYLQPKDIIWVLVYGSIPETSVVEYINVALGDVISNLKLRDKMYSANILSETTNTGLTGIVLHKDGLYYAVRNNNRILDSSNSDWRNTLNYRLGTMLKSSKWFRPIQPLDSTPEDVWEYVSKVCAGYHIGSIESVVVNESAKINEHYNPKVALFY